MGIPRFYRYISERYPLINQPISDVSLLPDFDCFYLDMNGIIHNCTHSDASDDEKNTFGLREQLHAIFTYMDRLISHIIKPKQLVFIAIDGVAPRAKLNQQRSRRFRAGLERQEEMEKQFQQLQALEDEKNGFKNTVTQKFDSNSITPGTEFLAALSNHLIYFVRQKMKNDPLWSRLQVFFSGSEVPGEGEHKIVDFIRHRKMTPGYGANVRHCMYGSDADLMLLGLMTHEPHFTLVREVVVWGNQKQKAVTSKKIEEEQWQMVHLSLFREYLMMELRVTPPFDGERMLDDFILLTFLLGNDFIPHSPTLEISEDAIPRLLQVYREHLEKYPGQYLTQDGFLINIPLLQDLLKTIGDMEEDILFDRAAEEAQRYHRHEKKTEKKQQRPKVSQQKQLDEKAIAASLPFGDDADKKEENDDDFLPGLIDDDDDNDDDDDVDEATFDKELMEKLDGEFEAHLALEEEEEDAQIALTLSGSHSFQETKWDFYRRKFQISQEDPKAKQKLDLVIKSYLEALVWCLHYYFQGPPSWGWYYPYHYSPMISDLVNIAPFLSEIGVGTGIPSATKKLKFTSGIDPSLKDGPLLPFQQLMSNLPGSSSHLVPEPYRFLMLSPLSPIKHFYPEKFEIDMEGKRNAWEGVNLLPFIDVKLLLAAIKQYCPDSRLTPAERKRNAFGKTLRIYYDANNTATYPSTLPGPNGFPDIPLCHTRVEPYVIPVGTKQFKSQLMEGVQLPMAGFPSIYTIPLDSVRLEHIRVNCFGMGSRKQTLIIKLPPPVAADGSESSIPKPENVLGRTVLVNWPHLHEAFVVGLSTLSGQYRLLRSSNKIEYKAHEPDQQTFWAQYAFSEVTKLLSGRGIPGSGGLDLGEQGISCCLHVLSLQGMVSDPYSGALKKQFGTTEAIVPLQVAVIDKVLKDDRFQETEGLELTKRFPVDSTALVTSGPWLGCTAVVKEVDTKQEEVTVHVNTIDKEPPFGYVIAQQIKERFHPTFLICKQLGITPTTLGIIAGGLTLLPMKEDIGLNLKFRKDLLLPGYVRLVTRGNGNNNSVTEVGEDESRNSNVWRKGDIVKIIGTSTAPEKTQEQSSNNKKNNGKNNKGSSGGNDSNAPSTTWEYSDRAVQLIAAYKAAFPYVFTNLDKASYSKNYLAKEILGVTYTGEKAAKEIDAKMEEIKQWLDKQALGKTEHSKHIPITSKYLPIAAIRAVEAAGSIRAKEREKNAQTNAQKPFSLKVQPFELFRPNPLVNQDLTGNQISATKSKNKGAPVLGDRVINISARGVPFGARGTVVATHVTTKCVEVLFDEAFTGGEALYGTLSLDRGKIIPWNSLLCVSTPPGQEPSGPQVLVARPAVQATSTNGKVQVRNSRGNAPKKLLRPGDLAAAVSSAPQEVQKQPHEPEAIAKLINKWGTAQKVQIQQPPATAAPTPAPTASPSADEHKKQKSKKKQEKATKKESAPASGELAPSVAVLFSSAAAQAEAPGKEALAPSVAALFNAAESTPPQLPAPTSLSPPPAPVVPPVSAAVMSLFPHNYDAKDASVLPPPPPPQFPPPPPVPLYGHFPAYPPPPPPHMHGRYPPQSQYPPALPTAPSLEDFPTLADAAKAPKKKPAPTPSSVEESADDKQRKKSSKKNGRSNAEQPAGVPSAPASTPLKKEGPSLLLPTQILRNKSTKPSTSS